jgi:hypothetical protein
LVPQIIESSHGISTVPHGTCAFHTACHLPKNRLAIENHKPAVKEQATT